MTTASTVDVAGPPLATGWEPELDPGDTVLRRFLLHFAECNAAAAAADGRPAVRRDEVCVSDLGRPAGFFNSAVLLQPPGDGGWDSVLDVVEEGFATGTGAAYLWSAWPTPDLRPRGWELMGHPPLLVRAPGGPLPPLPAGLDIREVHEPAALEDWARVAVEGYPFAELLPYRSGTLLNPGVLDDPRWRFWVGYERDQPVAMGTLFVSHGFAQLALAATSAAARGRGYWYGLVRERLACEPTLLSGGIFSDHSRPGMERLGYLPVLRLTLWERAR